MHDCVWPEDAFTLWTNCLVIANAPFFAFNKACFILCILMTNCLMFWMPGLENCFLYIVKSLSYIIRKLLENIIFCLAIFDSLFIHTQFGFKNYYLNTLMIEKTKKKKHLWCWRRGFAKPEDVGSNPGCGVCVLMGAKCKNGSCAVLWVHVKEPRWLKLAHWLPNNLRAAKTSKPITFTVYGCYWSFH